MQPTPHNCCLSALLPSSFKHFQLRLSNWHRHPKALTNLVTMETFIAILGVFFFILSYKMWSLNSNCFVFPNVPPVCPLHFAFSLLPPLGLQYPLILPSRRSRHAPSPSHHAYLSCGVFTACHCLKEWPWTWWSYWTTAFFSKALSNWRIPSHMP